MKYYVVLAGRTTGIFTSRDDCKRQVDGFVGAKYKSFTTQQAAAFAWKEQKFGLQGQSSSDYLRTVMGDEYERSICTDAACPSNPGPIEYRGVDIASGQELFNYGPYDGGSVNIGEFLAIVEGIRRCICHPEGNEGTSQLKNSGLFSDWTLPSSGRQKNGKTVLYTDSKIALSRTLKGNINTTIRKTKSNILLFEKIQQAEERLQHNSHRPQCVTLKKWPTSQWGQIPADFGRK